MTCADCNSSPTRLCLEHAATDNLSDPEGLGDESEELLWALWARQEQAKRDCWHCRAVFPANLGVCPMCSSDVEVAR